LAALKAGTPIKPNISSLFAPGHFPGYLIKPDNFSAFGSSQPAFIGSPKTVRRRKVTENHGALRHVGKREQQQIAVFFAFPTVRSIRTGNSGLRGN
jgi:hypothetical protein